MSIPFTQYLLPDGRKKEVTIDLEPEVEEKAQKIMASGLVFECEMLSDYATVSLTITSDERDEAIKICPNGPQVPDKVKELIMDFDLERYKDA